MFELLVNISANLDLTRHIIIQFFTCGLRLTGGHHQTTIVPFAGKMLSMLTVALVVLIFLQCNILCVVGDACEKEADLNFESCDLKHLNDDILTVSTSSILISLCISLCLKSWKRIIFSDE